MLAVIRRQRGKTVYFIDGYEVTKDEFDRQTTPPVTLAEGISGKADKKRRKRGYPIKSVALAVHSSQVGEAQADSAKKGVPTEFTSGGRPILRDASHRRKYLKAYGFHDRNSYNGH